MLLDRSLLRQTRSNRLALFFTLLTGLLNSGLVVAAAYQAAGIVERAFLGQAGLEQLAEPLAWLALIVLLRSVFQFLTQTQAANLGISVKEDLRQRLLSVLHQAGPVGLSRERSGELLAVLTDGIEALDPYFSQYLPQLVLAALAPLIILGSILPRDALSFLVLLATAPLLPFFMILLGSMSERSTRRQWEQLVRLGSFFQETLQGFQLLASLNRQLGRGEEIRQHDEQHRRLTLDVLRLTFLSAFVLEFISTIGTAVVSVQIGLRLLTGQLGYQTALFILLLAPEFYLPLRLLGARFHAGMSGRAASLRIFQLLSDPAPAWVEAPLSGYTQTGAECAFPIEFKEVSARYPGSGRDALQEVSFRIQEGERVAIVGPSGAGKSTLAYLLLDLLPPSAGSLLLGGQPFHSLPREVRRGLVSWVPQSPYLFPGSVAENICLFEPGARAADLWQAAERAALAEWIATLPQGLDSPVGERGARLSTGQAQRLALARAFYRDAPLLVLDEPTSALDPDTEEILVQTLGQLERNRTVLTIAHRLATVRDSDLILVLEEGRLVGSGRHLDLLAEGGLYSRLWRARQHD